MQGALAMAFVIEGLLFAFHLRGDLLDVEIHTLLVITIFLTAVVIFAEIQHKSNVLLSALRANLVIMQGVWFVQAAYILFRGRAFNCCNTAPAVALAHGLLLHLLVRLHQHDMLANINDVVVAHARHA